MNNSNRFSSISTKKLGTKSFLFFKKVQIEEGRKFFFIGKVKTIYICRHKVDLVEGHIKKTVIKSVKIVHKIREITFKMDD